MNRTLIIATAAGVAVFGAGIGIGAAASDADEGSSPALGPPMTAAPTHLEPPLREDSGEPFEDDADAAEPDDVADVDAASATNTTGSDPQCIALEDELIQRDDAGLIDWDALEVEEASEDEFESVVLDPEPFDADVADPDDDSMLDLSVPELDIATVSDVDVLEAVELCYEFGLLVDEFDEGDEDGELDEADDEPADESDDPDEGAAEASKDDE